MTVPTCKRCGAQHFNFKPCAPAPVETKAEGPPLAPPIQWNTKFDEGFQPWGDRFDNFEKTGVNTLWVKRAEKED